MAIEVTDIRWEGGEGDDVNPGRCPGLNGHCAFSAPCLHWLVRQRAVVAVVALGILQRAVSAFGCLGPIAICASASGGCGSFRNVAGRVGGNFAAVAVSGSLSGCKCASHGCSPHRLALVWGQLRDCLFEANGPTGWLRLAVGALVALGNSNMALSGGFNLVIFTDGLCHNFNIML